LQLGLDNPKINAMFIMRGKVEGNCIFRRDFLVRCFCGKQSGCLVFVTFFIMYVLHRMVSMSLKFISATAYYIVCEDEHYLV